MNDLFTTDTIEIHPAANLRMNTVTHARKESPNLMTMTWQPIDTAPKDGTEVLLFVPRDFRPIVIGHYVDTQEFWYGKPQERCEYWSFGSGFMKLRPLGEQPTYWMPLPDEPATREETP